MARKAKYPIPTVTVVSFTGVDPEDAVKGRKYWSADLVVDGKTILCSIEAWKTDGSIAEHRGKYYVCLGTEKGPLPPKTKDDPHPMHLPCQVCEKTTAVTAAKVLFPMIEKAGFKVAKWDCGGHGGWWTFDVESVPRKGPVQDLGGRRVGPEATVVYRGLPYKCPIHGDVVYVDSDMMD